MTKKQGLSGAALKWIAVGTMLIDHIGLVLVWEGWIEPAGLYSREAPMALYAILRGVGRLAFPIFCFLLSEGFTHTRSRGKYLLRLLLFALVSELPFDLAVNGALWAWKGQNVFFTLALGLLAIWAWRAAESGESRRALRFAAAAGAAAACFAAAHCAHADYGALGVLLILVFDLFREQPLLRDLGAAAVLTAMVLFGGSWWIELFGILALLLLHAYTGERGRQSKWFFYIFYPAHFLLLILLRRLMAGG